MGESRGSRGIAGTAQFIIGLASQNYALAFAGLYQVYGTYQESRMKDPEEQGLEIRLNRRGGTESLPIVYGARRVGGVVIAADTEDLLADSPPWESGDITLQNYWLHFAVAHCATTGSGIEGIKDVWIGNERVPDAYIDSNGMVTAGRMANTLMVRRYRGADTQVADDILTGGTITTDEGSLDFEGHDDWPSTARGNRVAYTAVVAGRNTDDEKFRQAYPHGWPNEISVEVLGERVYDPRKDDTAGGSGDHRLDDPATWEYSENSILIAANYATRSRVDGGMGWSTAEINWDITATEASHCDELVTTPDGDEPRYRCNLVCDARSHKENLTRILQTCLGGVSRDDGKIAFRAGVNATPVDDLDADWLAGETEVQFGPGLHGESLYNAVRVAFRDPDLDHEWVDAAPFTNPALESIHDGQRLWRDIEAPGIAHEYQAQRLAVIRGREAGLTNICTVACNLRALAVKEWDVVRVDLPEYGLDQTWMRIVRWQWIGDGTIALVLEETASDHYTVTLSDYEQLNRTKPPAPPREGTLSPANLTTSSMPDAIQITWTPPAGTLYDTAVLQRCGDSGGAPDGQWTTIGNTRGSQFIDELVLDAGDSRWYRVRAERPGADPSPWSDAIQGVTRESGRAPRRIYSVAEPTPATHTLQTNDIWFVQLIDPSDSQPRNAGWSYEWSGDDQAWTLRAALEHRGNGAPDDQTAGSWDELLLDEAPPGSFYLQLDGDPMPMPGGSNRQGIRWGKDDAGEWHAELTGGTPPGFGVGGRESGRVVRAVEDSPGSAGQAGREHDDRTGIGGYGSVPLPHLPIWSADGMDELISPIDRQLKPAMLGPGNTGIGDIEDGGNRARSGLDGGGAVDLDVPRGFAVAEVPAISTSSGRTRKTEPYDEGDSQIGTADPVASLSNGADVEDGSDRARSGLDGSGSVDLDVPLGFAVANVPAVSPSTGRVRKTEPLDGGGAYPVGTDDEVSSLTDGAQVKADAEDGATAKVKIDAGDLIYPGGTPIDNLKPAEGGAEQTTNKSLTVLADRTADNVAETSSKKWAGKSGANLVAGHVNGDQANFTLQDSTDGLDNWISIGVPVGTRARIYGTYASDLAGAPQQNIPAFENQLIDTQTFGSVAGDLVSPGDLCFVRTGTLNTDAAKLLFTAKCRTSGDVEIYAFNPTGSSVGLKNTDQIGVFIQRVRRLI